MTRDFACYFQNSLFETIRALTFRDKVWPTKIE